MAAIEWARLELVADLPRFDRLSLQRSSIAGSLTDKDTLGCLNFVSRLGCQPFSNILSSIILSGNYTQFLYTLIL
jgi:hypothetical protein